MEQISHLALLIVFAELPTAALLAAARVCRRWRDVLADPASWAHVDYNDKWAYLKASCRGDSLPAVQLALSRFQIGEAKMRHHLFEHVGHLEVAKWMAPQCGLTLADLRHRRMYQLEKACLKGRADYVRWMLDTYNVSRNDIFSGEDLHRPDHFAGVFAAICSRSDGRNLAVHLIDRYNITVDDLFRNNSVVLRAAAAGDNFEWLLARMSATMTSAHKEALYYLCNDARVDTLARILDRMNFSRSDGVELLNYACLQGSIDAAQLLLRRYGVTQSDLKSSRQRCPLTEACERGDVRLATWLVDTAGVCAVNARLRYTLYTVCDKGHSDMLEWLADRVGAKTIAEWISDSHLKVVFVAIRDSNLQLFQRLIELASVTASDLRNCIPHNEGRCWTPHATDGAVAFQTLLELAEVTRADLVAWKWGVLFDLCHHDNLPLLKWFVDKFKPTVGDIRTERLGSGYARTCLTAAMVMGAHDTARWLIARFALSIDDICVSDKNDEDDEDDDAEGDIDYPRDATHIDKMFDIATDGEGLWIFDHFDLTAEQITPNIFRKACALGYLRTARAIATAVRPTPEDASFALYAAEADGHDDVVAWLRGEFDLRPRP
jgi:hypothetical protein